jgi:hypothetical protein
MQNAKEIIIPEEEIPARIDLNSFTHRSLFHHFYRSDKAELFKARILVSSNNKEN